ncbi:hypothetical protein [Deinococcus sp.]|uniref:hypothetical protein n=1 Tax=Deinococcus sp. TaxID=47478 RepID=UPI0025F8DD43|nr:hypothetical protein [Deinococcus sp.]
MYVLKGTDQNGAKFEGKLKISNQATEYDEGEQRYYVDADKGYMVVEGGNIVQAWLELDKTTQVICVPYQNEQGTSALRGTALRGTTTQINELIRRYNGTDSSYYGSSACNITRG